MAPLIGANPRLSLWVVVPTNDAMSSGPPCRGQSSAVLVGLVPTTTLCYEQLNSSMHDAPIKPHGSTSSNLFHSRPLRFHVELSSQFRNESETLNHDEASFNRNVIGSRFHIEEIIIGSKQLRSSLAIRNPIHGNPVCFTAFWAIPSASQVS